MKLVGKRGTYFDGHTGDSVGHDGWIVGIDGIGVKYLL